MKTKPTASNLVEVPGWRGKFWLGPNHTYWWKDTPDSEPRPLSGITTILGVIAKPALIQWAANMAVEYMKDSILGLTVMGELNQEALLDCLEGARTAHNKKKDTAAEAGHDAHALIEDYIKWHIANNGGIPSMQVSSPEPRVREFAAWAVQRNQETKFRFLASEMPLADPKLAIAGTPDFIAEEEVNGVMMPMIGDLKTGSGVYDRTFFAQMAAYGYMWMKRNRSKIPPTLLVVHAPAKKPGQAIETYYSDDFRGDFEGFRAALTIHRWKDNFARKNNYQRKK